MGDFENSVSKIVVFDGDCSFCSSSVSFSAKRLELGTVGFVASQSPAGKDLLKLTGQDPDPDSILVYADGQIKLRSDATFELLGSFKRPYRWLVILRWVPRVLRDWVYGLIAGVRRSLWSKGKETCDFSLKKNAQFFNDPIDWKSTLRQIGFIYD